MQTIQISTSPLLRALAATSTARCRCASSFTPSNALFLIRANTRRHLSTNTPVQDHALKTKAVNETAAKGAEGLHSADTTVVRSVTHDVKHKSDVPVLGDWVLFHPVYSEEEVKAVQVCIVKADHVNRLIY